MQAHNFRVAELNNPHCLLLIARKIILNYCLRFLPFSVEASANDLFFQLTVDDSLKPVSKEQRRTIRNFDTGNGDTIVDRLEDGGYHIL